LIWCGVSPAMRSLRSTWQRPATTGPLDLGAARQGDHRLQRRSAPYLLAIRVSGASST